MRGPQIAIGMHYWLKIVLGKSTLGKLTNLERPFIIIL